MTGKRIIFFQRFLLPQRNLLSYLDRNKRRLINITCAIVLVMTILPVFAGCSSNIEKLPTETDGNDQSQSSSVTGQVSTPSTSEQPSEASAAGQTSIPPETGQPSPPAAAGQSPEPAEAQAPSVSEPVSAPSGDERTETVPSKPEDTDPTESDQSEDDLVIQIKDISEQARFYPVEVDGTTLEVLAVKAPDGTIRTAFNTCQVCYDSGRGYYKQEDDVLVCQNCGNRFSMDRVEVESGGCNPVPIFPEYKTETEDAITISYRLLSEAKDIFSNWKTEY